MKPKLIVTIYLLLFIGTSMLQAQNAFVTAGGDVDSPKGEMSYTVGQTFFTLKEGEKYSSLEGIQQPIEISEILGIQSPSSEKLDILIYPNPTSDILFLKSTSLYKLPLCYVLCDAEGKELKRNTNSGLDTKIEVADLPGGLYLLRVWDKNNYTKTFKILKNNK